jgi:hypothetical protein
MEKVSSLSVETELRLRVLENKTGHGFFFVVQLLLTDARALQTKEYSVAPTSTIMNVSGEDRFRTVAL